MNDLHIHRDYESLCREAASRIARLVREKPACVLGLATGSTPIGVYRELARLAREENLDFSQVTTFNLDEYYPMQPQAPQSYNRFMREQLFDHINCEHWHVPDGRLRDAVQIERDCETYEEQIQALGGLDLQLLGIGRTGHIGFNEPGSARDSRTRLVTLDLLTRADAAADFFGLENVPVRAITMGIGTVLSAREIILMASGARKAAIAREALEGKITSKVPASFLREHGATHWFLDEAAARDLVEYAKPWRAPDADFADFALRRRAFIAVSRDMDKPLAKLSASDLQEAGVGRLAHHVVSLEAALQEVENDLRARMDDNRLPKGKNVLCLSPHPDDDVVCCGATLLKMSENDNRVSVAYGVSGGNAVRDKDVLAMLRARHPRLVSYIEDTTEPGRSFEDVVSQVRHMVFEREAGQPDAPLLRQLKRLVREGEAADACRKMSARPLFLDLPFYGGSAADRHSVSKADVAILKRALHETQPDLVMLTAEMNDPHGTHEMCAQAFERAAHEYSCEGGKPFTRWHYRGAWNEFEVWEGDYISVFGKALMERKVGLILDHISQLEPMFPGDDPREFYERVRDRNRSTARQLQALGVLAPSRSFDPLYAEIYRIVENPAETAVER